MHHCAEHLIGVNRTCTNTGQVLQGNCTSRAPRSFGALGKVTKRSCVLLFSGPAIELQATDTRIWLSHLHLQLRRPEQTQDSFKRVMEVDAEDSKVWMTNVTLAGDGGVSQGLWVGSGSHVYLRRAPCHLCDLLSVRDFCIEHAPRAHACTRTACPQLSDCLCIVMFQTHDHTRRCR